MNWIRLGIYFVLGILISSAALETILRFLPVTRGLFRTIENDRWPLYAYTPHKKYTYSMTWDFQHVQSGYTNNYGHLAPFDFVQGSRPIIVLGDSFIEAQMLPYPDTLQAQLERATQPKVPVYGLGISGNSTAEYLAVAGLAKNEFHPRAAVILLTDGDISEALEASPNHYYFEPEGGRLKLEYQPFMKISLARRIREPIGDSALFRYVFSNLKFSPGELIDWFHPAPALAEQSRTQQKTQQEREVVDVFLDEFSTRSGIPAYCTVFLFDSDRIDLYEPGHRAAAPSDAADLMQYFSAKAQQSGYRVIDMKERFASHYRQHHQRFDFWPVDRHWNWLGHKLAAEAALDALQKSAGCLPSP